ncbi:AMP-binding protein [Ochrobactrum grignonense]|nr:AMP-binding protein [Brucella grignonensis]
MMLSVSGNLCRKFPVVINLAQAFSEAVNRYPTRIAVKFDDSKLTYAELDARANELADYIVAQGMHQSRIGLCVDRSLDMIIGILGILKAGCAYIPIDPNSPSARQQFIAQDSGVELLLTQSHLRDRIQGLNLSTLCLDADWDMIANQKGKVLQIEAVSPDSEAYVIYTSGTTGQPKGVVISHKNVIRLFRTTNDYYGFNEQDIWPLLHSFAFDVSVWEIWGAFLYGGTLIVVSHDIIRSPNELTELLIAEKATILNQTPSAFRLLMKADNLSDLASNGNCV